MDIYSVLPIVSFVFAAYATFNSLFTSRDKARLEAEVAVMRKQLDLIWGMVEKHMTTILHSPHTPARDRLLEKIQAKEDLTDAELDVLSEDLEGIINDNSEIQGNRAVAVFLLACVERCKQERSEGLANVKPGCSTPGGGGSEANSRVKMAHPID